MTTLTPEDRARLRDLTSQATPGPWRVHDEAYDGMILAVGADEETVYATDADMALMGAARTAIPAILDALEAAYEIIARQERTIEGHENVDAVGLRRRAEQAEAQVQAVRELHNADGFQWVGFPRADKREVYCTRCHDTAPCPTIRALDAALAR